MGLMRIRLLLGVFVEVRSSPPRLQMFKKCIEEDKVKKKKAKVLYLWLEKLDRNWSILW